MTAPWWKCCPHCGSPTKVIRAPKDPDRAAMRLRSSKVRLVKMQQIRQCPSCGVVKIEPLRRAPYECQQCGYNLWGNRSGACPECGWNMPPAMRKMLEAVRVG